MNAPDDITRARAMTEAWLRGCNESGHVVTPADIADVYRSALSRLQDDANATPTETER